MSHEKHGMHPFKGLGHLCAETAFIPGRFARLFHDLPPLYVNALILHEVGKAGGKMEDKGQPNLAKKTPAGLVFFGQFIDHDITLDTSSSLTATNDPQQTANVRTPSLDLDCVYGDGPGGHPYLYDGAKLLTGVDYADPADPNDLKRFDLPRTPKGTAIIGDPRNDENRVISQMQLGFLKFHNTVVDKLATTTALTGGALFEEARRVATWHYQWVVVNDFLRAVCGSWIVEDILTNGRKVYRPECIGAHEAFIPIEFATAAYRFGHTMVPQNFSIKPGGPKHDVFGPTLGNGFSPINSLDQVVEWSALLDSGNGQYERAGEVDAKLAKRLLDLPFLASEPPPQRSLAVRNLLRAQSFLVPSGEQVANKMIQAGAGEITSQMISNVRAAGEGLGLLKATPLWLYILLEGKVVGRMDATAQFSKGEGLGPVGARLVAEVLIGLLERDARSFLGANRNWSPLDDKDKIGSGVTTLYQLLTA